MSHDYHDKIDDSGCYFCARQTDIEAHHIVPQRFNGSDSRENLVGVCERCHKKLERLYDKRFYERLGISDESGERKTHFQCQYEDCKNRAKIRYGSRKNYSGWLCLDCATEWVVDGIWKPDWEIVEDFTDRLSTRIRWIRYAETSQMLNSSSIAYWLEGDDD